MFQGYLVSFDIDGTMEFGEPPGPIAVEMVLRAKSLGCIIGSASDRTVRNQSELWERHGVEVDFVSLKHRLIEIVERFSPERCIHIGDTEGDKYFAGLAGFDFHFVDALPDEGSPGWIF
jgi:hypothetical protein